MFGVLGFREKGRGLAQGVGFRDIMDKACGLGILGFQGVGFWLSVGLLRFGPLLLLFSDSVSGTRNT